MLVADDLTDRTLVTLPVGTLTRTLTDRVYQRLGVRAPRVVTTTQRDALVPFTLSGLGVTFVPDTLARTAADQGAVLGYLPAAVGRRFGLVYRAEDSSPALSAFLAVATVHRSDVTPTS